VSFELISPAFAQAAAAPGGSDLMTFLPAVVQLRVDGSLQSVPLEEVRIGDVVMARLIGLMTGSTPAYSAAVWPVLRRRARMAASRCCERHRQTRGARPNAAEYRS